MSAVSQVFGLTSHPIVSLPFYSAAIIMKGETESAQTYQSVGIEGSFSYSETLKSSIMFPAEST